MGEEAFLIALHDVADAHGGIRRLAQKTGLNREHIFRMLSRSGNPNLANMRRLTTALGLKLTVPPA